MLLIEKHVAIALDQTTSIHKGGRIDGQIYPFASNGNGDKEPQRAYQILNVFFPARETTTIVFANVLFELARHPHIWDELRAEVTGFGPDQQFTFEMLKELKTTKAIINETLRIHLPASRIACVALKDTVLPVDGGQDGRSLAIIRTERPSRRNGALHPTARS